MNVGYTARLTKKGMEESGGKEGTMKGKKRGWKEVNAGAQEVPGSFY